MQCPVCDVTLSISSRDSVEIDFCPQCRGVWLDRGELDKIIERAAIAPARSDDRERDRDRDRDRQRDDRDRDRDRPRDDRDRDRDRPRDDRDRDDRDRYRGDDRYDKKKKRRSFLEDIFDFD
jgi:Zn-finger nucleic acid-binding protein